MHQDSILFFDQKAAGAAAQALLESGLDDAAFPDAPQHVALAALSANNSDFDTQKRHPVSREISGAFRKNIPEYSVSYSATG
ncbi:hypothetical protein [Paenibacillus spiritus]|uniref:hypothetical protein n=1 Tax=Paenibacillus spiritus TaxID=2496557 RepID=UPI00168B424C|nr:hypothetical protein [Paenibacillus spiritus]